MIASSSRFAIVACLGRDRPALLSGLERESRSNDGRKGSAGTSARTKSLPIYKDSRPAIAAHFGLTQSLRRHCCRSARIPGFLEAAQTAQQMSLLISLKQFVTSSRSAFQKYNSTIGFIGFRPTPPFIIDKTDNLDDSSI
jgi:hypothetical protein